MESDNEDVIVPGIPPGTAPRIEESQGGDTILVKPLAIRDPERLRLPPDIASALEPFPGSIPGTDRATGIDSACKDGIGAL
jgi:hypothetical protein